MSSIVNENGPLAMTQERAPEIWQAVPHGFHLYAFSLRCFMIGMSFFNNVDVARIDRSEAEGFSLQAVLKVLLILAASVLGGWGWWKSPELRKLLLTLPGALFMLLGVWYFVSVPWSLDPKVSLTAAVLYWGGFIFCLACIRYVGGTKVMLDICVGQFLFLFFSVVLYFFNRELAMFTEVLSPTTQVIRFGGLGHPNVIGRISVFLGLLLVAAAIQGSLRWRWFLLCLPIIVFVCIASLSRTPIIAGALAISIVSIPLLRNPHVLYLAGFGLLLAIVGIVALELTVGLDTTLLRFIETSTKTGSMEEVTTMTGRTRIWAFAIEKTLESPIVGWGAGCTPILMANIAGHAHNILLQPTVSLGIPGGLLFALILLWNVYCTFRYPIPILQMCTVFILTLGIAETPLFNPLPECVTLMWFAASFWPLAQQFDRPLTTYQRIES